MSDIELAADYFHVARRLSPRESESIEALRTYLERDVRPQVNALWSAEEFPRDVVKPLAALGVFGPAFPEVRAFESSALYRGWLMLELARVDASLATFAGVQTGLSMGSIAHCGSEEQVAHYLPRMASGDIIGCFGLTEPKSGSDSARGLTATAERRGDNWVLNGEKRWIGNGTWADICIFWAKDVADGEVKGFIVPTSTPGFHATKIVDKLSLRIVQNADLRLTDVRVSEADRLQRADSFRDVSRVLRHTRSENGWIAAGLQIGAYEAALAYAKSRHQFGRPIGGFQLMQDLLVKSLSNITATLTMMSQLADVTDRGDLADEMASLAKAFTTSRARETVSWCRELVGGNGVDLVYDVARYFADAEAVHTYEGTREMNTLIVGRDITGIQAFV
ncbi:acyl-CoA dehydrogenase family protein [Microbacterium sp. GXF7504]